MWKLLAIGSLVIYLVDFMPCLHIWEWYMQPCTFVLPQNYILILYSAIKSLYAFQFSGNLTTYNCCRHISISGLLDDSRLDLSHFYIFFIYFFKMRLLLKTRILCNQTFKALKQSVMWSFKICLRSLVSYVYFFKSLNLSVSDCWVLQRSFSTATFLIYS